MAPKRFGNFNSEDINAKRSCLTPQNTALSNNRAASLFKEYLHEIEEDEHFEQFSDEKLDELLCRFYINARKKDGEPYKVATLENIRYGLNRYLQAPPYNRAINIITGEAFTTANLSFRTAMMELKSMGLGDTTHHPILSDTDRRNLYSSFDISTPVGLQEKVQFDLRIYFMRRGMENIHSMTKDTFEVKTDDKGNRYVTKKIDELTKNRRESDKEKVSGVMPATNDCFCPVKSYEKYLSKLNPVCPKLWQRPLDSFQDEAPIWYCNVPVGMNTLKKFMAGLSKKYALSQVYTNHCLRATGATLLTRENFSSSQIMSVSGHWAVSSLAVYQRTSLAEQMTMGQTIARQLRTPTSTVTSHSQVSEVTIHRAVPQVEPVLPAATAVTAPTENSIIDLDPITIEQLFTDFDQGTVDVNRRPTPVQLFTNCSIQNVNIVVKK